MSHILVHTLPILGEYRSPTDLKCTQPLHILIEQTNTTMWWLCSPWTHTLMDTRQFFGGSILAQVYQIWDHSLPILNDGSSSTEVWNTQPLQIPIAKNNTTKPLQCSAWTHNGLDTRQFLDGSIPASISNLGSFLANTQWWKQFYWQLLMN